MFESTRSVRATFQRRAPIAATLVVIPIAIVLGTTAFFTKTPQGLGTSLWLLLASIIFIFGLALSAAVVKELCVKGKCRLFVEDSYIGLSVPPYLKKFSTYLFIELIISHTDDQDNSTPSHGTIKNTRGMKNYISSILSKSRDKLTSFNLHQTDVSHINALIKPQRQASARINYSVVSKNGSTYNVGESLGFGKTLDRFVSYCEHIGIEVKEVVIVPEDADNKGDWRVVNQHKKRPINTSLPFKQHSDKRNGIAPKTHDEHLAPRISWTPLNRPSANGLSTKGISTTTESLQRQFKEYDDKFAILMSATAKNLINAVFFISLLCTLILAPYIYFTGTPSTGIILAIVAGSTLGMISIMKSQDNSFYMEKSNGTYYIGKKPVDSMDNWEKSGLMSDVRAFQILTKRTRSRGTEYRHSHVVIIHELNLVLSEQRRLHILERCDLTELETIASVLKSHYNIPVWKLSKYGEAGSVSEMAA